MIRRYYHCIRNLILMKVIKPYMSLRGGLFIAGCLLCAAILNTMPSAKKSKKLQHDEDVMNWVSATDAEDVVIRQFTAPPQLVVYNRVPKCASLSTLVLFNTLNGNNTRFLQFISNHFSEFTLRPHDQYNLVKNLTDIVRIADVPVLYDRHVQFIDFEKFGFPQPVYINLIRDPIEQYASLFSFLHKDNYLDSLRKTERHLTLEECVDRKCVSFTKNMIMSFLCGHTEECQESSQAAVEISKRNVEKHYLLVGVQEELDEFFWTLEKLLPSYFDGLHKLYKEQKDADSMSLNVASRQRKFPERTLEKMKRRYRYEYDFYRFVRQRQHAITEGIRAGTLQYVTHQPLKSSVFQSKGYLRAKDKIIRKYGKVEQSCETCMIRTDGV